MKNNLIINNNNELLKDNINEYVNILFATDKLYGFGHRIHKDPKEGEYHVDPRAGEYLEIINDTFTTKYQNELILIYLFLDSIRKKKPPLACNSDFAIALFLYFINIRGTDAEGAFIISRIPGFCARIAREPLAKGNARRSPFPPMLPYHKK